MPRIRLARAFAVLVLILAQAALGLPHHMMVGAAAAHAEQASGGMPHQDCHHPGGKTSHQDAPIPPCGSCPASMPGQQGGCLDMASCGPTAAAPSASAVAMLPTVLSVQLPPAISSPAAHEFIPDPPPPRA